MGRTGAFLQRVGSLGVALRPTLFAYQFLYELAPTGERAPIGERPLDV